VNIDKNALQTENIKNCKKTLDLPLYGSLILEPEIRKRSMENAG